MVTDDGQLYTIEGVASALLMVLTAYMISNSTFILTPGDTHISDMQLEQLGNDVLKMMDTADTYNAAGATIYEQKQSFLESQLSYDLTVPINKEGFTRVFIRQFRDYADDENIKIFVNCYYYDGNNVVRLDVWDPNISAPFTGRDHYVTITRWVHLNNPAWDPGNPKSVLLEVWLWRD